MRKIIVVLTLVITFNCVIFPQLTQEEINYYISELDSTHHDLGGVIDNIIKYKLYEAVPKLEDIIWKTDCLDGLWILRALIELKSSKAHEYTLMYVDSLNISTSNFAKTCADILRDKVDAVGLLFELGDYSKADYVFELRERNVNEDILDTYIIHLISKIYKYRPELAGKAKTEILNALESADGESDRFSIILDITNVFGEEMLQEMIAIFKSSKISQVKRAILELYFSKYENKFNLNKLLRESLVNEESAQLRIYYIKVLLFGFAGLEDYKFVKDYLPAESNDQTKNLIWFSLETFRPVSLEDSTTVEAGLNVLNEYIDGTFEFNWLQNDTYKNQLMQKIENAKNYLSTNDSINCAKEIEEFQKSVDTVFADSAASYPKYVSDDAYKFLYYYAGYILERLPEPPVTSLNIKLIDSQNNYLFDGSLQYYESGWKEAINNNNGTFTVNTEQIKLSLRMTYENGSQTISNVPVTSDTAVFQTVDATVELRNSENVFIPDSALVKYYASGWRDFGYTANGAAHKELLPGEYSFRMTYAYASNDKKQNLNENKIVTFNTVNTTVELRNSENNLINEDASVKYYASGWREFGETVSGIAQKELLPNNYSFRMTYAYASNDKKQDLNENTTVTFNTVNTVVELRNSENNLITEDGSVKYYASGWRDFGVTVNGAVQRELLPNNYSFRMTYAFASNDKKQDLNENTTVTFNTANTTVELRNSENNLITEDASVKYYASGWRDFGVTVNGAVQRELLPNNYSFRMTYAFASNDKKQDLNANTIVTFNTVNTIVELRNSDNNLINEDVSVKYYASGWRDFGSTVNGVTQKELLPNDYSFRMTHAFLSNDKKQDVGINNTVTFNTILCTVNVNDSDNLPVNNALVKYYASGWRDMGLTADGTITKQMLPGNISFRVIKDGVSQDKQQDLNTNKVVQFILGVEQ